MSRYSKTPRERQDAAGFSAYSDLDLATKLLEAYPTRPSNLQNAVNQSHIKPLINTIGWMPNACWWCSGEVIDGKHHPFQKIRGTGKDPFNTEQACPYCEKRIRHLRDGGAGEAASRQVIGFGPQAEALAHRAFEILMGGARGGAKLSPLDSLVLTPKGFVKMGDIRPGSIVTDPTTGGHSVVLTIHPQGKKDIYRVTFDDGASLEVGLEHLWSYKIPNHHRPRTKHSAQREFACMSLGRKTLVDRWNNLRVGNTSELIGHFNRGFKPRIPLTEPVLYTSNRLGRGQMPPYIAGVLLGDGSLPTLQVTACDDDVRTQLRRHGFTPYSALHTDGKPKTWAPKGSMRKVVDAWLRNNKLRHARSWEKFIPAQVHTADLEYRLEFLRGLMDTDGTVDERGRCYFSSCSKALAEGVQDLVRGLGGKARIREHATAYQHRGEKHIGRRAYKVRIWLPKTSALFKIERKRNRCTDSWNGGHELMREVASIEYVGKKEAQCITVSSPYGLYVADDFIVTHNSNCLTRWMTMGNPYAPKFDELGQPIWHNQYCVMHPAYRGLVIRRNEKDLRAWLDDAIPIYKQIGGELNRSPLEFRFKWGSRIYLGHMDDASSWEKYQGMPELHKLGIEELCQIPDEKRYEQLLACVRSKHPELPAQVFTTANPIGAGLWWVRKRFVDVVDETGEMNEPGKVIRVLVPHPYIPGEKIERTRVYVPARLQDNPHLLHDQEYLGVLASLDEDLRRAYIEGDWFAVSGEFFKSFRPKGPRPGEPESADHVVLKMTDQVAGEERKRALRAWNPHHHPGPDGYPVLGAWWPRGIGLDYGYNHRTAVYWGAHDPVSKQLHVYHEEVASGITPTLWGRRLAERSLRDLDGLPDHHIICHASHELFQKKYGPVTIIQMVAAGIEEVLGQNTTFIPSLLLTQMREDESREDYPGFWERYQQFEQELKEHQHRGITLAPAGGWNQGRAGKVPGWHLIRELMLFDRPFNQVPDAFDESVWARIYRDRGDQAAAEYLAMFRQDTTMRPRLQIWDVCKHLIAAIPRAVHQDSNKPGSNSEDIQKEHFEGKDSLDALWHLCVGMQNADASPPFAVRQAEFTDRLKQDHPEYGAREMIFAQQAFEQKESQARTGLYFGRMARSGRSGRGQERIRRELGLDGRKVN